MFTHYVPSFYGDVRVFEDGPDASIVETTRVTELEKAAIAKLEAVARKKGWLDADAHVRIGTATSTSNTPMRAPVHEVSKVLARVLKPKRHLVTAVKFSDGKIEELREPTEPMPTAVVVAPAEAAATVAAPTLGCPAPDFHAADRRAGEVLRAFLSPAQRDDMDRFRRFVTRGRSGRRYMVTHRAARDQLATYHRTLFDLDAQTPLCVHDWAVPACEEMLALHLLVQLEGWESFVRGLDERGRRPIERMLEEGAIFHDAHGRPLH